MVVETAKHGRMPTIIFVIFALIMIVFSIITMIDLFLIAASEYGSEIDLIAIFKGLLNPVALLILAGVLAVIVIITFAVALFISWLMSKIATEVTVIAMFAIPVLLFTAAGMIAALGLNSEDMTSVLIAAGFVALIGLIALVLILWKLRTIMRAGKFIEFAAELMIDNKSLYFFPIVMAIALFVTFIFGAFSALWIIARGDIILSSIEPNSSQYTTIQALMGISLVIVEFFYVLSFFVIYYIITGMVMSYAARWYRGEDPGPKTAIHDIKQVMPVVITYAAFTTTVHMVMQNIRNAQRNAKFPINMILGGIVWFAGAFYAFFTYFTLPAIIIQKKGFRDSAVESGKLVWKSAIDVLMSDTGFGLSMFVFGMVNRIIWFMIGFSIGAGLSEAAGGVLVDNLIVGFVIGIVFFIFLAGFSMSLINMPMKAAFVTFLYSFAIDAEEGFRKPSRLPVELRNEFSAISERAMANDKRKMRDPFYK
ncbi:MAG: hypothetical protein ACFFD4_28540 [Candidatus Odinarchaeota archaeon]